MIFVNLLPSRRGVPRKIRFPAWHGALSRPRRQVAWLSIAAFVLLGAVGGCGPSATETPPSAPTIQGLIEAFPPSFQGSKAQITVVDRKFLSGTDADDVLAALGKSREQALVLIAEYGPDEATAIAVPGVTLPALLKAAATAWRESTIVGRREESLGGRRVVVLTGGDGYTYVLAAGANAIFVVSSASAETGIELLEMLIDPSTWSHGTNSAGP